MSLHFWGPVLASIVGFWLYTSWISHYTFPTITNKRILLLTAHPDDEAMFFAPTVLALARPDLGNQVKIMCLSSGNADGLGETRKKELTKSVQLLNLDGKEDLVILDDPNFQDGPHHWDRQTLSKLLITAFAPDASHQSKTGKLSTRVDVIITFDQHGVSNHPNHISCFYGVQDFLAALKKGREGWACPVTAYSLVSVALPRKYIGVLDCVFTFASAVWEIGRTSTSSRRRVAGARPQSDPLRQTRTNVADAELNALVYVSGLRGWVASLGAMISGHWSQMVWFRWGWIFLGRYMIVNDLRQIQTA